MFDSHAHVTFEQFAADREAVLNRAGQAGVTGWVEVGTDVASSGRAAAFARQYTGRPPHQVAVWASAGVHPSDIAALTEEGWAELTQLADEEVVVAIGEVGLDFYRGGTAEQQVPVLERFIDLAVTKQLPVIFHVRDAAKGANAHDELLQLLAGLPISRRPRGVIHTFSGTEAQAEAYLQLGLHLSFSGVVTFDNAGEVAAVAGSMPLHRMLIETDCPFLAPAPHRGQRNEPAYVHLVAQKIAELRGTSPDQVIAQTAANTQELFGLT